MALEPDDDDRTLIRVASHAAPASIALPIGSLLGEFELLRIVGDGGFGIVYEALDRVLHRHVAIKEFMPSALASRQADGSVTVKAERHRETFDAALRSFVNEARLLAHFDHPALVKVHRFWEASGTAYMAMPLYHGVTLLSALRQTAEPPSEALLLALLEPLTEALLVLHDAQIYHRDIAPDNIMLLADSGKPLLMDFGAARHVIGDMTQALTVILKAGYAPIEQYAEAPALRQGPWTDVYALGAVVYFALTRTIPPPAISRMLDDRHRPLAEVAAGRYSARFIDAIDRALIVMPNARTQSIEDLRQQLGFARVPQTHDSGWSQFADSTTTPTLGPRTRRSEPAASAVGAAPAPAPAATSASPQRGSGGRRIVWASAVAAATVLAGAGVWRYATREVALPAPIVSVPAPASPPASTVVEPPAPTSPPAVTQPSEREPFDAIVQGATPGFEVSAQPSARTLKVNRDRLTMNVTAARDGFVYLFLLEPGGKLLLIFPNALSARSGIRANRPLALPQREWPLTALEPAGTQHFLVLVSQRARDFSSIAARRDGPFTEIDASHRQRLPAVAPLGVDGLLGRTGCEGKGCEIYGAATFKVEIVR